MGSDFGQQDEKPGREVCLDSFHIDKNEVTQEAFEKVMKKNPSHHRGPNLPVEGVTYVEGTEYCDMVGKRLPTEAEWEYAARAGTTTEYYWGNHMIGSYAWVKGNSRKTTHPVGQRKPNAWGLHDMTGNVWEWVRDYYDANYYSGSTSVAIGASKGSAPPGMGGSMEAAPMGSAPPGMGGGTETAPMGAAPPGMGGSMEAAPMGSAPPGMGGSMEAAPMGAAPPGMGGSMEAAPMGSAPPGMGGGTETAPMGAASPGMGGSMEATPMGSAPPGMGGSMEAAPATIEAPKPSAPETIVSPRNPAGPLKGQFMVIRGGSWDSDLSIVRSANRGGFKPGGRSNDLGFRCAQ